MFIDNPHSWIKGLLLAMLLVAFGSLSFVVLSAPPLAGFASSVSPRSPSFSHMPMLQTRFASHDKTASVHSAAVVEISGGRLRGFWYGGSHEHAKDVAIYTSVFDPEKGLWSPEIALVTREDTQRHLNRYIKKLGNVVVLKDRNGYVWLFYVSVSVGRWSGSAINLTISKDDGETWSPPRRLISSPFFNLSTLVKGPPLLLEDGTIGLPVYHEFIGRFGELLRLDRTGKVIQKTRLSWGTSSLQPVIIPRTTMDAVGLMRYSGPSPRRILSLRTTDGGFQWSQPVKTDLPNPNSAVAGIRLDNGALLLTFNDSEDARDDLALAYRQSDADAWRIIYHFEKETAVPGGQTPEFSYPSLIRTLNGDYHLLYTWHRNRIKHIQFNQAWLEQKLQYPSRR
jgi:predicted neuraminidase